MSHPPQDAFAADVNHWSDIPGWFHWREGQEDAVATFPEGSTFLEVGSYLGRSLCSLADVVHGSGRDYTVIGVDTCRGSGEEGQANTNAHGPAVEHGGGSPSDVRRAAQAAARAWRRWLAQALARHPRNP